MADGDRLITQRPVPNTARSQERELVRRAVNHAQHSRGQRVNVWHGRLTPADRWTLLDLDDAEASRASAEA